MSTVKLEALPICSTKPSMRCILKATLGPLFYIIAIVALAQVFGLRPAMADNIDRAESWFNKITTYKVYIFMYLFTYINYFWYIHNIKFRI